MFNALLTLLCCFTSSVVPTPRMSQKLNVSRSWHYHVVHHLHFLNFAQVLCLHLKRFKFQAFHRSKVDTYVQFPVRGLDMSPYCMKDQVKKSCVLESYFITKFGYFGYHLVAIKEKSGGEEG